MSARVISKSPNSLALGACLASLRAETGPRAGSFIFSYNTLRPRFPTQTCFNSLLSNTINIALLRCFLAFRRQRKATLFIEGGAPPPDSMRAASWAMGVFPARNV